ncbi:type III-B CRISPR module RAMP protein Cmr4 [Methanotrichaceae archaeon Mx]|uniref:Type III-B CRISPR module RAMP protein Cmr4 n=2 Tax=Candidatus Methanocrinis natronophilus TaxID=3033396 RepID=A0ABT5X8F4_9EURY|nr:type III-B CRISPR module RAMP protein Cmr4 [Candidatus Methanocrinis natronophilus]
MTTDPVHIGTGGMRLGRVDNSIVREPGTRLPKVPGTSLSGAIRSYSAYRYGKRGCSGQGGHCGRPTCPICYTFGSVGDGRSYSGVVSIGDARLLLFPVYSMTGPVWVSTEGLLNEVGFTLDSSDTHLAKDSSDAPLTTMDWDKPLNLGWLMIKTPGKVKIKPPNEISIKEEWKTIGGRIVLISDKLFSQVVNSNLEVRTSVAIDPETGAAEKGALFTYEAIPRAAFLWLDVVVDDFRGAFPSKEQLEDWMEKLGGSNGHDQKNLVSNWHLWKKDDGQAKLKEEVQKSLGWIKDDLKRYEMSTMPTPKDGWKNKMQKDNQDGPQYVITAGVEWIEHLGIGGMGTRGFGRVRALASCEVDYQTRTLNDCQSVKSSSKGVP